MDARAQSQPTDFVFPKFHAFPALYTLQPNPVTRQAQYQKWSRVIQLYCRHARLFRLRLPACLEMPLFRNSAIKKKLAERDVRNVLTWIASPEGGQRGEWVEKDVFFVYWKRPEEWAETVYKWVDEAGQKGAVLTYYELLHGDATLGQDFHDMDAGIFAKAIKTLEKKGTAVAFGLENAMGIKFL